MAAAHLDFGTLQRVKNKVAAIRRNHVATMAHYVSDPRTGFWHQPEKKFKSSLSSTATCVMSMVNAGVWDTDGFPLKGRTQDVASTIIAKRESAGLDKDNPFSLAFVAEGILDLSASVPDYQRRANHLRKVRSRLVPLLLGHLSSVDPKKKGRLGVAGVASMNPYPPSAYLTQLVFRVLRRAGAITAAVSEPIYRWAKTEINKQVALLRASSRDADAMQLAYALILAATTTPDENTSPEDKEIFEYGIEQFFSAQKEDGSWPLSKPLFHYPEVGNAHCFEFELLSELLGCRELWNDLIPYIPRFERCIQLLSKTAFDLNPSKPGTVIAWASGHHPQIVGPESWSTACVYLFAYRLDRLLAEAIRRSVFEELGAPYAPPTILTDDQRKARKFAPGFLDAELWYQGKSRSLRETLWKQFVQPLDREAKYVLRGDRLSKSTAMSAIFFGPPGTSKTQLAEIVSQYLGWPLLMVDPSYLVSEGMDSIQAVANKLFSMLAASEQMVVLLDEFDEMGRDRSRSDDRLSRLITTAMLPKLVEINKERRIVFLLATNYISGFDAAFSRSGRFDLILQVMPPSLKEKLKNWPAVDAALKMVAQPDRDEIKMALADLTFDETKALAKRTFTSATEFAEAVRAASSAGTMARHNDGRIVPTIDPAHAQAFANKIRDALTDQGVGLNQTQADSIRDVLASIDGGHATWKDTSVGEREKIRLHL